MNIPKLYVIEDTPKGRNGVLKAATAWNRTPGDLLTTTRVTRALSSDDIKMLQRAMGAKLDVEYLGIEGYITDSSLGGAVKHFAANPKESACLLLDFRLLKQPATPKNADERNFVAIVKAFNPGPRRIVCIASSAMRPSDIAREKWPEAMPYIITSSSMEAYGDVALLKAFARWLRLNSRLYDALIDDLWAIGGVTGHGEGEEGTDKASVVQKYIADIPKKYLKSVQKALHPLTMERSCGFPALWILSRVAFEEVLPGTYAGNIFKWDEFGGLDVPALVPSESACLPKHSRENRKMALLLFGELCRNLFVLNASEQPAPGGTLVGALTHVGVTSTSMMLCMNFPPKRPGHAKGMAEHVSEAMQYCLGHWGADAVNPTTKMLCSPRSIEHHLVSDVIIACWLAFRVVSTTQREPGENFLGGAHLSISERMSGGHVVGTEVKFYA